MGAGGAGKLRTELETLRTFKGEVDKLLDFLLESEAAPHRMAENHIVPAQLGVNFAEVNSLYSAYNEVHGQLKNLSQLLSDQIEALSTAVHAASVGYANVDTELRDRMWAIQARTRELYEPKLDPNEKARRMVGQQPVGKSGGSGSSSGSDEGQI